MYLEVNIELYVIRDQQLEGVVSGVQEVKALIRVCECPYGFSFNFQSDPIPLLLEAEREGTGIHIK